jgi:hypothetical protein
MGRGAKGVRNLCWEEKGEEKGSGTFVEPQKDRNNGSFYEVTGVKPRGSIFFCGAVESPRNGR